MAPVIRNMIKDNPRKCEDPELTPYYRVREELSWVGGVFCKNNKIIIPPSLQKRVVRLCHQTHQGMSKTKAFARACCWFPGLDAMIEQKVKACLQCQAVQDTRTEQPVKPRALPDRPWQQVEMDFQGPYPNGQYIFVMVDRYSRWPEIKILGRAPNAKTTISAIDRIFQRQGVPEECQSDNGPPFQSSDMANYAQQRGYQHKHITPEWPRANGMVERFNRSMKEALQAANLEGKTLSTAAHEFVERYRATPHSATEISPFEAMHGGRKMKTSLPIMNEPDEVIDRQKDEQYKAKMGKGRGAEHGFQVGDGVLMRQKPGDKLSTRFNPNRMIVTDINGSSVTVSDSNDRSVFRDASQFRRIAEESDSEEDTIAEAQAPGEPVIDEPNDVPNPTELNQPVADAAANGNQPEQNSIAEGRTRRQVKRPVRFRDE